MLWFLLLSVLMSLFASNAETHTLSLEAGEGPVILPYVITEESRLSVITHSPEGDLDLTLEILLNGQRLAFNDDHHSALEGLNAQDSAIIDLPLTTLGAYEIRVHTFSGAQSGPVEVQIITAPLVAPCVVEQVITLNVHQAHECTLSLSADSRLTLSVMDHSGNLDPVLRVYTPQGELAALNDDQNNADLRLNVLDAQIRDFSPSHTGEYTLAISDFTGAAGEVILWVEAADNQPE